MTPPETIGTSGTGAPAKSPAHAAPVTTPAGIVWMNGRLLPVAEAQVGILDRGFLFGDGVYELIRFFGRVGVGMELHRRRLETSLRLARIEGFDTTALPGLCDELLLANALEDATVYVQVTRGAATQRTHLPPPGLLPTVVAIATPAPPLASLRGPEPIRAVLLPDERWLRCEIKSTSLMGNVLAAMSAAERGADEAILHRDGVVSEGSSTNVFLWFDDGAAGSGGTLVTPATGDGPPILHGVSRIQLIEAAQRDGLRVEERIVRIEELPRASEIMVTSSRRLLSSVVELDGRPVGCCAAMRASTAAGPTAAATPGTMARHLFDLLRPHLLAAPAARSRS